jgi:hypothetical protein
MSQKIVLWEAILRVLWLGIGKWYRDMHGAGLIFELLFSAYPCCLRRIPYSLQTHLTDLAEHNDGFRIQGGEVGGQGCLGLLNVQEGKTK